MGITCYICEASSNCKTISRRRLKMKFTNVWCAWKLLQLEKGAVKVDAKFDCIHIVRQATFRIKTMVPRSSVQPAGQPGSEIIPSAQSGNDTLFNNTINMKHVFWTDTNWPPTSSSDNTSCLLFLSPFSIFISSFSTYDNPPCTTCVLILEATHRIRPPLCASNRIWGCRI